MKVLDLFSGIGGFSLGLERAGMETVAFCEIDPYCQKVLRRHWPHVPIYPDVRTIDYDGTVDVICGGFPCQPFSVAGKQRGREDDRYLWPSMLAVIKRYRPSWVIGENVPGIIGLALDQVLSDMESAGYACQTFIIPACGVDAPHRRDRVWIVAHSAGIGCGKERTWESFASGSAMGDPEYNGSPPAKIGGGMQEPSITAETDAQRQSAGASSLPHNVADTQSQQRERDLGWKQNIGLEDSGEVMADPDSNKRFGGGSSMQVGWQRSTQEIEEYGYAGGAEWSAEPAVGRVAHGIPGRVDRLRALGNAVVPQIPEILGKMIMQVEDICRA